MIEEDRLTPRGIFARSAVCRFSFLWEITLLSRGSSFSPSYQSALEHSDLAPLMHRSNSASFVTRRFGPIRASGLIS